MAIVSIPTFISLSLDVVPALALELCRVCVAEMCGFVSSEFPCGSRQQQVPKVLVSAAELEWEGAGVQLSTARHQQQLLQQTGLSLGFPLQKRASQCLCWRSVVMQTQQQSTRCRMPQGSSAGLTVLRRARRSCRPKVGPCSASDTPCWEHPLRLQAAISS